MQSKNRKPIIGTRCGMWLLEMSLYFAGLPSLIVDISNISRKSPSKKMHVHPRSHKIDFRKWNTLEKLNVPQREFFIPLRFYSGSFDRPGLSVNFILPHECAVSGNGCHQTYRHYEEVDIYRIDLQCAQYNQVGRKKIR